MMDIRFLPHNTHLDDPASFSKNDPHLKLLQKLKLIHRNKILDQLPTNEPGIYSISGGRQIGKTTLLKQWMNKLLQQHISPSNITFLTGELIDDQHSLVRIVTEGLNKRDDEIFYLMLDEISYIKNWDKGIKYLADSGLLENTILILTGSDTAFIKDARMRFPGRRGKAEVTDFHLFPLSFGEFIKLKKPSGSLFGWIT